MPRVRKEFKVLPNIVKKLVENNFCSVGYANFVTVQIIDETDFTCHHWGYKGFCVSDGVVFEK